jgi:hypothetical protein
MVLHQWSHSRENRKGKIVKKKGVSLLKREFTSVILVRARVTLTGTGIVSVSYSPC